MSSAAQALRTRAVGSKQPSLRYPRGAYPERDDSKQSWLDRTGERAAGVIGRRLRARRARGERIARGSEQLADRIRELDDSRLRAEATDLRARLGKEGFSDPAVAHAFALVREAATRTLGERPYRVQLLGGAALLGGCVAEMETGEGKTLTATLPACTAALAGIPVHVITVNDYLVGRDAENMGPVYRALGLSVGAVQHGLSPAERSEQYARDVVYVSNKELVFDYLKDRIALGRVRGRVRLQLEHLHPGGSRADRLILRGLCYGIVDEADSVLVDEARTPLIISGAGERNELEEEVYETALELARGLGAGDDFRVDRRERRVELTPAGEGRLAERALALGGVWSGRQRSEELVRQALTALHLFERDQHYLVHNGRVQIIDEYTGRVMADRSWEHGLHQLIEAKEECEQTGQVAPLARISYQRFFRRYMRLAGMTGTAREVAGELWSIYRLPVVRIPTNKPLQRRGLGVRVHATAEAKWAAVVARIRALHERGRPVLVGTRSVAASEQLSALLTRGGLEHCVLNARQDADEADIIARAGEAGRITVATNMAGRGTDIVPDAEAVEAGGLHVIATERHEAGRIDRQLFGRGGRQGDPGSYELLASLEDDLVRSHGRTGWLRAAVAALERPDRAPTLRAAVLLRVQRRAERLHSRIRRDLVKMDERVATMLAFSGRSE